MGHNLNSKEKGPENKFIFLLPLCRLYKKPTFHMVLQSHPETLRKVSSLEAVATSITHRITFAFLLSLPHIFFLHSYCPSTVLYNKALEHNFSLKFILFSKAKRGCLVNLIILIECYQSRNYCLTIISNQKCVIYLEHSRTTVSLIFCTSVKILIRGVTDGTYAVLTLSLGKDKKILTYLDLGK